MTLTTWSGDTPVSGSHRNTSPQPSTPSSSQMRAKTKSPASHGSSAAIAMPRPVVDSSMACRAMSENGTRAVISSISVTSAERDGVDDPVPEPPDCCIVCVMERTV